MLAELACFEQHCRARFPIDEAIYNCPACGTGLLEVVFTEGRVDAQAWKQAWRSRRMSNDALDQSGVWRYRELLPFDAHHHQVVSLREGNTPLLNAPRAAGYGGLDQLTFKHQGFNPTGSFKDNGMTCGVTQAVRLDRQRVACVSTGNTSASMAAYSSAAGLDPIVFIPHGNISYGKLAQALEYGARTMQVEANFDQILGASAHSGRTAGHLPAQFDQSISNRRPEDHHFRTIGPARLESTGLDRVAWWQSRQYVRVRKGPARVVPV